MGESDFLEELRQMASRDPEFDGSLWELDGWTPEDARRQGALDAETRLARRVLAHLCDPDQP